MNFQVLVIAESGRAEGREEGRKGAKTEMAAKLIQGGQMSLEGIIEVRGLPIDPLREIKTNISRSV